MSAGQKPVAVQDRILLPQGGQVLDKSNQRLALPTDIPVEPTDLIVLAIRIVVALLRAPEFIAGQEHRGALGKQERRQKIPDLSFPQGIDFGIIGGAFDTTVPGAVVAGAVLVVFAVRLVMFVV